MALEGALGSRIRRCRLPKPPTEAVRQWASPAERPCFCPPAPRAPLREGARSLKTKQHVRSGEGLSVLFWNASRFDSRRLGFGLGGECRTNPSRSGALCVRAPAVPA